MKTSLLNKVCRSTVLTALVSGLLWLADKYTRQMLPKSEGWILIALTTAFLIPEMFFWNAVEAVSKLAKTDYIDSEEARSLAGRIQTLKRRMVSRWFTLLALKAVAGTCAAFLTNQDSPGGNQRLLWLIGVGSIALSVPIALSFFYNWAQADAIDSEQTVHGKQKSEQKSALQSLSKSPDKPRNADKALKGYKAVVASKHPLPKK